MNRNKGYFEFKKRKSSAKLFILMTLTVAFALFFYARIIQNQQKTDAILSAQVSDEVTDGYNDEITDIVHSYQNGMRIYSEYHDNAEVPYVTVYTYEETQSGTRAAVPPPVNFSGTNYYRVTSTDTTEDSGDKVCAKATGTACAGYVDESITGFNVCKAFNPTAAEVSGGSGTASVAYCDGPPQGGVCNGLTNTCLACPACSPTSCSTVISGLYREMYVTCSAGPAGTDLCTAGLDDDDGSGDGILDLTASETSFDNSSIIIDGCTIAIDGAHSFTNVQIIGNGVLTQSPTDVGTINTTDLTVSGDFSVELGSSVDLDGKGAKGQNHIDPSVSTTNTQAGGRNSHAGTVGTDPSVVYGDYFDPQYPGSGGSKADGDGGGAIEISTNTFFLGGTMTADGATIASCGGTSGSGGSIKISATGEISGGGSISANAGTCTNTISNGSGGRIAIIYSTVGGLNTTPPEDELTLQAVNTQTNAGVPGTIYLEDTNMHTANEGRLIVDGESFTYSRDATASYTGLDVVLPGTVNLDSLEIDNVIVTMDPTADATLTIANVLDLQNTAELTYTDMASLGAIKRLIVDATGATIQIDATSLIDARGKGARRNEQIDPDSSTTNAVSGANTSHGGLGLDTDTVDNAYGDFWDPQWPGSGSNSGSGNATGGGVVDITAQTFTHNGTIRADGNVFSCNVPPGSGGAVKITTTGVLSGNGVIQANAGNCTNTISASGAGRVAFYYTNAGGINPTPPDQLFDLQAQNTNPPAVSAGDSSPGTVYIEDANEVLLGTYATGEGRLIIDNGTEDVGNAIGVPILGTVSLYELTINHANVTAEELIVENSITLTDEANLKHQAMESLGVIRRLTINSPNADLSVDATSSVNVSALGAIGNQQIDPDTSTTNAVAGANQSHGGAAGSDVTEVYGDFYNPIYPGSGGTFGGSRGGGVAIIDIDTLDLEGSINASARIHSGCGGTAGSGGAAKITIGSTYTGSGTIQADGGNCTNTGSNASGGRIAFFYTTAGAINGTPPDQQYTLRAYAIDGGGSAGTIYIEDAEAVNLATYSANEARLLIENGSSVTGAAGVPIVGTVNLYELFVDQATVTAEELVVENSIVLQNSSQMKHQPMASLGSIQRLTINSPNATLSIDGTSLIDLNGLGAIGNQQIDPSSSTTNAVSSANRGHGGINSTGYTQAYGDFRDPQFPGSGGNVGAAGGGYGTIAVSNLDLSGTIRANGGVTGGCGGAPSSAGALKVITTGELTGAGTISAIGGYCTNAPTSTSGGGRIAFFYDSDPSGAVTNNSPETIYSLDVTDNRTNTGPGTVYIEDDNATNGDPDNQGDLIIDGTSQATVFSTPLFTDETPTSLTLTNVSVINGADLILTSPCTGSLTVTGTVDLSGGGTISDNTAGACTTSFAPLSITSALPDGNINTAYSEQVDSPGGYAPKTFECLDGLGGSVVACNAASGWPNGISMNASGLVSGTPTNGGTFSPIIRVTDSDPGGAQVVEQTMSLLVNSAPNAPTLVSPADASQVGTTTPTLSAQYSDPDSGDTGTTDYRISSGSAGDCLSNTNIVDSGTSAATGTNNEATTYTVGVALSHASTYNWCARNDDGNATSNSGNFTTMGSFTVNLGNPPNNPVLVSPGNTDTTNQLSPLLEANYSDPDGGDVGTTEFRVSSGSAADCLSNTNVVFSGSSAQTATNNETASVTVGVALTNLATYNWCARNNDGIFTSNSGNFTTMGSFLVDTSFTPGGGIGTILNQQQQQQGGGGDSNTDPEPQEAPEIDSFGITLGFRDVNNVPIPAEVNPDTILFGTAVITNTNSLTATDVFFNLELPSFVDYVRGSLQITGQSQTDGADEDPGQANTNAISVIWASLAPNASQNITFQLLTRDAPRTSAVEAIQLQGSVSASNANETFFSNLEEFSLLLADEPVPEPVPEPEPIPEPEPTPEPDPVPTPDPEPTPEPDPVPAPDPIPAPDPTPTPQPTQPSSPVIPLTPTQPSQGGNTQSDNQQQESQSVGGETNLFITGSLQSQNEQVQFSGTVNEPNAEVTVIINNQSFTVTSDENGFWQAFVSAEEIGVPENASQQVNVEAFAVDPETGEESNRIQQQIFVERIGEELVVDPIEVVQSSNTITRAIDQLASQVEELIEEQEEEIQTTLAIAAPVVVVTSVPLWGYLPYVPTMFFHLISWIIGLLGRKKQQDERFYGIVYNSISKQPLALAVVRIYKLIDVEPGVHDNHARQLVKTVVTDKQGRYEALLEPGEYEFDVKKPQFTFPSSIIKSGPDGDYLHIYSGELNANDQGVITIPDIPVDPENAPKKWQTGNAFKKLWMALQKVGNALAVPVLFLGAASAVVVLVYNPMNGVNWILAILYVFLLIMQITFRSHPEKAWGMVYDVATNAALPLTTLQLIDPEFGKVVKSRLSDYEGRFSFLPEPGKYVIKASKEGYTQAEVVESRKEHSPIQGEVNIEKEGQQIDGDIAMRQASEQLSQE